MAADDHTVYRQHDDGSDERHPEACALTGVIQAHCPAKVPTEHCAHDTEQHRHDDAARISTRHHELREGADHQAEKDPTRSEEHTSELQSLRHLVCRLLLEKKK